MEKKDAKMLSAFRKSVSAYAIASLSEKEVREYREIIATLFNEMGVRQSLETVRVFALGLEYATAKRGDREKLYQMLGVALTTAQEMELDKRMTLRVEGDAPIKKTKSK
jgi:hypothetical protein